MARSQPGSLPVTWIGWKNCLVALVLTVFHGAIISIPPIYIRLDQNKDDEFCFIGKDERSIPDDGIRGCVLDYGPIAQLYGAWFGFHIALLLATLAVTAVVAFVALRRRPRSVATPAQPSRLLGIPSMTLLTCLVLSGSYAVAPVAVALPYTVVDCAFDGFAIGRCADFGFLAFRTVGWGVMHAVAMMISSLLATLLLLIFVGLRSLWRPATLAK